MHVPADWAEPAASSEHNIFMDNMLHTTSGTGSGRLAAGQQFDGGWGNFVLHMAFTRLHLSSMAVLGFIAAGGKKDV